MSKKLNWSFKVQWLGETHIIVCYKKQDDDVWEELTLTVREYTEWMALLQTFNANFKEQIDNQLIQDYLNG